MLKALCYKINPYTMINKLKGHAMFADEQAIDRLKMCDNCRVFAMTKIRDNPMAFVSITDTQTTEYYLRERYKLCRKAAKDIMKKETLLKIKSTRPHSIPTFKSSY